MNTPTELGLLPHASTAPTLPSHSCTTPPFKSRYQGVPCRGKLHVDWQMTLIGVVAFNNFNKSYALRTIYLAPSTGIPSAQRPLNSPKQYSAEPISASTSVHTGSPRPGPTSLNLWHPIDADAVNGTWQKPRTISYNAPTEILYTKFFSPNSQN